MNRDKQIEDMAKAIDDITSNAYIENYDEAIADADKIAEALYNAGYRKQSEGEWKKTLVYSRNYDDFYRLECNLCGYEHEPENEEQYKYCPNCGAKMKGGAE